MSSEVNWDEARAIANGSFPALESENVPLHFAPGRTAAEDLRALAPLPFYETSAMDGWVVAGPTPWKIVGDIPTGVMPTLELQSGECARIGTGGIIPSGASAVIRWEDASEADGVISGDTVDGKDIRPAGLECKTGDLLVAQGTVLQPAMVGILAATGYDSVPVTRKPRVALFFLGDELIHAGLPAEGKIRDSLGVQIPALYSLLGVDIAIQEFIDDEYESLLSAVKSAAENVDIIITTGGTADGPRDHVHPLLDELGAEYLVDRVKARPGHPSLLAKFNNGSGREVAYIGLPGNPQSAMVCTMTLGIPLINSLLGKMWNSELPEVVSAEEVKSPADFHRIVAGRLVDGEFYPAEKIGSNMLRGVAHSTGFGVCNPGITRKGENVRWMDLPGFSY